jgi:hypothetical protein
MSSTIHPEAIMTRQSIGPRAIRRLARAWADMDYAQRRLFEIQTGIPATNRPRNRTSPGSHRDSPLGLDA